MKIICLGGEIYLFARLLAYSFRVNQEIFRLSLMKSVLSFWPINPRDLSHVVLVTPIFSEIFNHQSFYGMTSRLTSNHEEGVHFYVKHCLLTFGRRVFSVILNFNPNQAEFALACNSPSNVVLVYTLSLCWLKISTILANSCIFLMLLFTFKVKWISLEKYEKACPVKYFLLLTWDLIVRAQRHWFFEFLLYR